MFHFITHRPLWVNILAAFLLAVGAFFLFYISLGFITHHGKSKLVPYVLNKSLNEAIKILENAGFSVEIQDSAYNENKKPLAVLKQVPGGDAIVKDNRTVYLIVNKVVPPMIEMPNLISYSFRTAELILQNSGLKFGDTIFKPDFAKHAVLEMIYRGKTIEPGTKIPMSSTISLVLGNGIGDSKFLVPDLVGKTYADAIAIIQEKQLSFGVILAEGISDTASAYIYWQNPTKKGAYDELQYIRSGQLIDIKLQLEEVKPDSLMMQESPKDLK